MLSSFIIVLREGFEAFLIVAIAVTYLRKIGRDDLVPAVWWGIAASILASVAAGYVLLLGVDQAFWEGVLGLVAMVMVTSLVVHMWRMGPRISGQIRDRLDRAASRSASWAAFLGVFVFTLLMITREGMETALMLFQIRKGNLIAGCLLGLLAAGALAMAWGRYGHRIDIRRFFQVTGIFLLLFVVQIGIYTFHEFSEAGILPESEAIHAATEPYSPDGIYGKWFSLGMVAVCAGWLAWAAVVDRKKRAIGEASAGARG
jgi:high-affinity iron transporter